jgi:hypothetical protein
MCLARSVLTILLLAAALAVPGMARADDAPLYHVTEATAACADAVSVRTLTNQSDVRRNNPASYKSIFDAGRCVSVTSKSPWRFVSRDSDVVMMDYAGTVGPPGSYYFSAAQLVDANGNHPGDAPGTGAVPAAPTNGTTATPANPSSSETALAPNAQPASSAPTGLSTATWGVTNVLLLAVALLLAGVCGLLIGRRGPRV